MKIIYCPPRDDPMQIARAAQKRSMGGGGLLQENWWVILGVIAFVVIGVTVGPFKGVFTNKDLTTAPVAQQEAQAAPLDTPAPPVFCDNPGGGRIANGDTAWVNHGIEVSQYRCEGGQLVKLQTITQTVSTAP